MTAANTPKLNHLYQHKLPGNMRLLTQVLYVQHEDDLVHLQK